MGGRVYDPNLGRFLSADLFIQSPYDSQNYNRYSYVGNNPLSYIDPTGYKRGTTGSSCDADSCYVTAPRPTGPTADQLSYLGSLQNGSSLTFFYGGTNSANLQFYGGVIGGVFADPTAAGTESVIALAEAIDAGFSQANSALGAAVAASSNAARKAAGVGLERVVASLGTLGRIAMASPVGAAVVAMTPTKMGDGTLTGNAALVREQTDHGKIYYHYTSEEKLQSILSTGVKIMPGSSGKVYVTKYPMSPAYAHQALFMGARNKTATHVLMFTLKEGVPLLPGDQPNELIHYGTLRMGRQIENLVYSGVNPF